jgi:hypothetical protein
MNGIFPSSSPLMHIFFSLAGVAALVVLISHTDQINDLIFGNEGALKGLHGTLDIRHYSFFRILVHVKNNHFLNMQV